MSESCRNHDLVLSSKDFQQITLCSSNLQSELKTLMCPLMAAEFGFINEKTLTAIKSNTALVATVLVNHKNLTYKVSLFQFAREILMAGNRTISSVKVPSKLSSSRKG